MSINANILKMKLKISSNWNENESYFKTKTVIETNIISKLKLQWKLKLC